MLAYSKNSSNKFEVVKQGIQYHDGIPEIIEEFFVAQVDNEFEAIALINTIERYECELALREEFENNCERC